MIVSIIGVIGFELAGLVNLVRFGVHRGRQRQRG
jgi:hypothetical protein